MYVSREIKHPPRLKGKHLSFFSPSLSRALTPPSRHGDGTLEKFGANRWRWQTTISESAHPHEIPLSPLRLSLQLHRCRGLMSTNLGEVKKSTKNQVGFDNDMIFLFKNSFILPSFWIWIQICGSGSTCSI